VNSRLRWAVHVVRTEEMNCTQEFCGKAPWKAAAKSEKVGGCDDWCLEHVSLIAVCTS
jgi:hypothetical protein